MIERVRTSLGGSLEERWLRLEDYPNYAVSDQGRVCNIKHDRILRTFQNQYGVLQVGVSPQQGRQTMKSVALLVASTFMPDHNPKFNCPINLDGKRDNCSLDNLAWRPLWYARKYNNQFGIPFFHEREIDLEDLKTEQFYETIKDPSIKNGVVYTDIIVSYIQDEPAGLMQVHFRKL